MKALKKISLFLLVGLLALASCKNATRTQKGAAIGAAGGGAMGAVIGKASGNTALGAIIGATVGGAAGAVIGRKMDKQAKEIESKVAGAKVERVGEGIVVEFSEKVLFGFDQADLNSSARGSLDKLTTILNDYPDTNIEIQGHTDNVGTEQYNKSLSVRRASAVEDYLVDNGVSRKRVYIKGYGETAPEYDNSTDAGRSQNRRVEFLIYANEEMKEDARREAGQGK